MIAASVAFCFAGCKNSNEPQETPVELTGTVWKSDSEINFVLFGQAMTLDIAFWIFGVPMLLKLVRGRF